jgi:hypothetical protein
VARPGSCPRLWVGESVGSGLLWVEASNERRQQQTKDKMVHLSVASGRPAVKDRRFC